MSLASLIVAIRAKTTDFDTGMERVQKRLKGFSKDASGAFGKSSPLGMLTNMAIGGGALAGLSMAMKGLESITSKALELREAFRSGAMSADDVGIALLKSVPILGSLIGLAENLDVLITKRQSLAELQLASDKTDLGIQKNISMEKGLKMLGLRGMDKRKAEIEQRYLTAQVEAQALKNPMLAITAGKYRKREYEVIEEEESRRWAGYAMNARIRNLKEAVEGGRKRIVDVWNGMMSGIAKGAKWQDAQTKFAAGVREDIMTPQERVQRQIEYLTGALKMGTITWDEYGKAVSKARSELQGTAGLPAMAALGSQGAISQAFYARMEGKGGSNAAIDTATLKEIAKNTRARPQVVTF